VGSDVSPRLAEVPSGQTITKPASVRWMVQGLPSLPSEPEQAASHPESVAAMKKRTVNPLFIIFSSSSSGLRAGYQGVGRR